MFDAEFANCNLIKEYEDLCDKNDWNNFFQRIKNKSSIKVGALDCSISRSVTNRLKNTFREVVPYDFNRVILSKVSEDSNDYINGSHIMLHGRSYIMTQYPNSPTVELFWSMVWQYKSNGIIMLGKLFNGEDSNYFPELNNELSVTDVNNIEAETFHIFTKEQISYDGFIQRRLQLYNARVGESMYLWHFEFWSWPDQCVPRCMDSFLTLLGVLRQYNIVNSVTNPAIVHCSAGAGRSGTFCLVDIAIMLMEQGGDLSDINIPAIMEALRAQRMGIIRTFVQLKFCYEAIIEAFRKYRANDKITDFYLQKNDQPHFCNNYVSKTPSSSCSEEADLDTVLYQFSDESNSNSENNDLNLLTSQEISNDKNELTDDEDMDHRRICRQNVISLRKLKNTEKISILTKHLEENSLKRHRLSSTISLISLGLLDDLNIDKCKSMIVAAGLVLFMGTFFWHKYSMNKYN